ncbi:hypothetical protein JNW90_13230 [Micromonospora sp. STR1s_5]|nr:hypothetical protein [Micromonospora sp. STR1s_5]
MDAVVVLSGATSWRVETADSWKPIGVIEELTDGKFHVVAGTANDDHHASPLWGISHGPFETLQEAMAAISVKLGGTCERWRP